jgi:hypothetical protein
MLWSFARSKYAYLTIVQYIPLPAAPPLWSMKQLCCFASFLRNGKGYICTSETLIVALQSQACAYNYYSEKTVPFVKISKKKKLFSVCRLCHDWPVLCQMILCICWHIVSYILYWIFIYVFGYHFYLIFRPWTKHIFPPYITAILCSPTRAMARALYYAYMCSVTIFLFYVDVLCTIASIDNPKTVPLKDKEWLQLERRW